MDQAWRSHLATFCWSELSHMAAPNLSVLIDLWPVSSLLAEFPPPVQELPKGHALILGQSQLMDYLGDGSRG